MALERPKAAIEVDVVAPMEALADSEFVEPREHVPLIVLALLT